MANIPTRNNNPGDLKDPATGTFRTFSDPQQGFQALQQDLTGKFTGNTHTGLTPQSSLIDFANVWAPSSDSNNPQQYAQNLATQLGVPATTPIGSLTTRIPDVAKAIAKNEGWMGALNQALGGGVAEAATIPGSDSTVPQNTQQKYSPDQFAQLIKQKYPQYSTLDNADLTQRILAKYPQYQSVIDTSQGAADPTQTGANGMPTYGATFPYQEGDTGIVAGFKALGNLPSSAYQFGSGVVNMLAHPLQTTETIGGGLFGLGENIAQAITDPNKTKGTDQFQQTANAIGAALMQRYGSIDALTNTATNDPFGLGADIAGLLAGGAGLAGKAADVADLATGSRAALASEGAANFSETGLNVMPQTGAARGAVDAATAAMGNFGSKVAQTAISPITGAASSIAGRGADILASANPDVIAAAERTGVNLPAAALSNSPYLHRLEALAGIGGGQERYISMVNDAVNEMNTVAKRIVASAEGATDLTTAGEDVARGLQTFETTYKKATSALYDTIQKQVGDVAAQTSQSVKTIGKILDDKELIGDTKDVSYFQDKYGRLTGFNKQQAPTLTVLRKMRTALGQQIDKGFDDPFVRTNVAQLKRMYGALSQDIEGTIKATRNPEMLQMYRKANAMYVEGRSIITSQYAKAIRRLADNGQYSNIVDAIIKPSTALEDVPKIMQVVGEQGAASIRSSIMQRIFNDSRDAEGNFTAKGILRQMQKFQDERGDKLAAILKPEQIQGLQDMGKMADAMGKVQGILKGSQTMYLFRVAAEMGALGKGFYDLFTGNIMGGLQWIGGTIGGEGMGYFITSPMGQRLLKLIITRSADFQKTGAELGLTKTAGGGNIEGNGNDTIPGNGSTPGAGGGIPGGTSAPSNIAGGGVAPVPAAESVAPAGQTAPIANNAAVEAQAAAPAAQVGEQIPFSHYSGVNGIQELNPEFAGTGKLPGSERAYTDYPELYTPGTYGYAKGVQPEQGLDTSNLYSGKATGNFLKLGTPESTALSQKAVDFVKTNASKYGEFNETAMNAAFGKFAKEAGYDGIQSDQGVFMFNKTPVVNLQDVIQKAYADTTTGGGTTVNIYGDKPTSGFAIAPSKKTEFVVPDEQFTEDQIAQYVKKNYAMLQEQGNHVGLWQSDGKTYLDISKIIDDEQTAVKAAIKGKQEGIYDLKTGQTKLIKDYAKESGAYRYGGENGGTNSAGSSGASAQSGNTKSSPAKAGKKKVAQPAMAV